MNKNIYIKFVTILLLTLCAGWAAAASVTTTIDFEDGSGHNVPIPSGQYVAQGVALSNAAWTQDSHTPPRRNGNYGLGAESGTAAPGNPFWPDDTIVIDFSAPVIQVSILVFDVGENGAVMNAYDSVGTLLDSDQFIGEGIGIVGSFETLSVSGAAISQITLGMLSTHFPDGFAWDDLTFVREDPPAPVPLPAPIVLMLTGMIGLAGLGVRRKI